MQSSGDIIQPHQVKTARDVKNYFRQRLGSDFKKLPCVKLSAAAYRELVENENSILKRRNIKNLSCANEIFICPPSDSSEPALITFAIENPDVFEEFFAKLHPSTPNEKSFLQSLLNIHQKCSLLHKEWMQRRK